MLASVSWQSVCILWLCTALLVTYGDWPLGKYVIGEGGLIGVLMPLKTGGSALALLPTLPLLVLSLRGCHCSSPLSCLLFGLWQDKHSGCFLAFFCYLSSSLLSGRILVPLLRLF